MIRLRLWLGWRLGFCVGIGCDYVFCLVRVWLLWICSGVSVWFVGFGVGMIAVVFDLVAFGLGGVCFWVGGLAVLLVVYCMLCCSLLCGFCGGLAAFVAVWGYSGCESGWA